MIQTEVTVNHIRHDGQEFSFAIMPTLPSGSTPTDCTAWRNSASIALSTRSTGSAPTAPSCTPTRRRVECSATRATSCSKTIPELSPSFPADDWAGHWAEVKRRGSITFEAEVQTKDGRLLQVEVSINYLLHEGREYHCAIAIDVTEEPREAARREMEQELRRSEERFSALFYASPFSIVVATFPAGQIVYANDAFLQLFQFERNDVIGKSSSELKLWADEADHRTMIETLDRDGRVRNGEFLFRTQSGELRRCSCAPRSFRSMEKDIRWLC